MTGKIGHSGLRAGIQKALGHHCAGPFRADVARQAACRLTWSGINGGVGKRIYAPPLTKSDFSASIVINGKKVRRGPEKERREPSDEGQCAKRLPTKVVK
jgi:hypothetical protein